MSMTRNVTVDAALEEARRDYAARNPASLANHQQATGAMPGGNTRSVLYYDPFPLTFARGAGARLWDIDGHEYIDFLGEFTAGIAGHSHPAIRRAIERRWTAASTLVATTPWSRVSPRRCRRDSPRWSWCASPIPAPRRTCWR